MYIYAEIFAHYVQISTLNSTDFVVSFQGSPSFLQYKNVGHFYVVNIWSLLLV